MFIIRADGNAKIGAGHLMRCLTVADAMLTYVEKKDICFLCADEMSAGIATDRGYKAEVLNTDYRKMDQELDAWEALKISEAVILVDSYFVNDQYLQKLQRFGKVILIDDMQEHAYPVDAVINYNVFADVHQYSILYGKDTKCYIGSEYIPIREQFRRSKSVLRNDVENVLITTGGGDIENIAGQIYECLVTENENIHFHVVSGVYNPYYEALKDLEACRSNLHVYHNVKNMAELMLKCDLAITAGGSTVYELAALGVPFICFSYAENQEKLVKHIEKRDIAGYAGSYLLDRDEMFKCMKKQFVLLCRDLEEREKYASKEAAMVDGKGADRIAGLLVAIQSEEITSALQ